MICVKPARFAAANQPAMFDALADWSAPLAADIADLARWRAVASLLLTGSGTLRKTAYRGDWLQVDGNRVETPFYTVRLNEDGSVASLYDKKMQREWTDGAFNKLTLYEDKPGNYDAWDILPNYRDKQVPLTVAQPLTLIEQDSESVTFKTVLQTDKSTWTQYLRLFRRDGAIDRKSVV